MRKLLMILALALATTLALAQDQDNSAKQDMKDAGHATEQAAKKAGHGIKKGAEATGHGIKKGAVATKDKVTGGDDAASDRSERAQSREDRAEANAQERRDERAEQDRDAGHRALPQGEDNDSRRQEALEHSVHIVNGPDVDAGDRSATIRWQTNKVAATDVWLMGGGIRGHRTRYEPGGSDHHRVTFTGLRPHTTYTYEIRTREGGDRKQGTFTTR